jgi:hypothetical protein
VAAASSFLPWFDLQVEHSFFSDNRCRALAFRCPPEAGMIVKNAGLLIRNTPGGFQVYYDESRYDALLSLAANPGEPLHLEFLAFSTDPLFWHYTRPSPLKEGSVLYFSNQNTAAGAGGRVRLHQEEFVGQADFAHLNSPSPGGLLGRWEGRGNFPLVVNIDVPGDEVRALPGPPAATPKNYYISFQAGQTLWKYYLLGDLARESYYVNDREEQVEFVAEGQVSLAGERFALAFRSKTLLPLGERSNYHFQLRDRNSGGGRVLIRRLPVASPGQAIRESIDGENTLVSEMFINR